MSKKALMLAHAASMLCHFNMNNIDILRSLGYEVTVACNFIKGSSCDSARIEKFKAELTEKGVKYIQLDFVRSPFDIPGNIKAYRQLKRLLKNERFDLIHCHTPMGGILCRLAAKKYRKTGTKVIYTAHGFHFFKGAPLINWLLYYPAEKYCSRFTDVLVTINHEDFDLAKRKMHARRVEYIPGVGIDVEKFAAVKVDRAAKRREIGVPDDAFLLISVGELNKNKNHQAVIKAVARVKEQNLHYVIVGQGKLKDHLIKLSERLGVSDRVHLLGYRRDIAELNKCADVFCFPSKREGLGLAALEAMACGLSLITSNVGGIKEYSHNGFSGVVIYSLSVTEMVESLYKISHGEVFKNYCSKNNIETVKKYDNKIVNEKMKNIYFEV